MLALKGNQGSLHEEIELFLSSELKKPSSNYIVDKYEEFDKGHDRIERRTCYVSDKLSWLDESIRTKWSDLQTVAVVESYVTIGSKSRKERRYFISSLEANAKQIAESIRSHWAIENSLHWVLDVTLGEDASRIRKGYAAENMAMIRHISLNLLKIAKKQFKEMSIKRLQKKPAGEIQPLILFWG